MLPTITENVDYRRSKSCQDGASCGKCGAARFVEATPLALALSRLVNGQAALAWPADASAAVCCALCGAFRGWAA